MRYRFMVCCTSLCLTCMMVGTLLPLYTAYAGIIRIYAFQIMRPDPNRPESKGQVVQSVRIKYNLDDSAKPDPIVECVKTPVQDWQRFKSTKSLKFGSSVEFKLYTNPDCSGADATSTIYPGTSAFTPVMPAQGQVKADTCWINFNNFPPSLSGCNTGETSNSIKGTPTSPSTYPITVKIFRLFDSQVGAVRVTVNEHRDVLDHICIPVPKQDSELNKGGTLLSEV